MLYPSLVSAVGSGEMTHALVVVKADRDAMLTLGA
jgi:hypothetical protein